MEVVEIVLGLVVLAVVVGAVAERLSTPAPSLLVLAGLGVGFIPGVPTPSVSPLLITLGILPPLLYAAAQQLSLPDLRQVWRPVTLLAVGLVLLTATAVALVAHGVDPSIGLGPAFVLGAILAATDPVAVSALSRRLRLPDRVVTLVQAESLFNDATSLVLFQVAVISVTSGGLGAPEAVGRFFLLGGGGVLLGVASGLATSWVLRRAHEPTVQTAVALLGPYVAAVAAEASHVSPVAAVVAAGLAVAHRRRGLVSAPGRLMATSVYDALVFMLEGTVFALIGLELAAFIKNLPAPDQAPSWELVILVTVTLLSVRGAGLLVAGILPSVRSHRDAPVRVGGPGKPAGRAAPDQDAAPQPRAALWPTVAVVTWAGARGVVPLAAALAVPLTVDGGGSFPHRQLLLVVAIGAVVVSLVVQGSTLEPLVRRVGLAVAQGAHDDQLRRVRFATTSAALDELPRISPEDGPAEVHTRVREDLEQSLDALRAVLVDPGADQEATSAERRLRLRLLEAEADELGRLRSTGEVGQEVYQELIHELELEHTRLSTGRPGISGSGRRPGHGYGSVDAAKDADGPEGAEGVRSTEGGDTSG